MISVSKWIGTIHAPWSVKKLNSKDYKIIHSLLEPGDILLSKVDGHLSNLFIPGQWKHAAIAYNSGTIIEAISEGVIETDLIDFILSKDKIVVLRSNKFGPSILVEAANQAKKLVGSKYDFEFKPDNLAFYCAELVWSSYNKAASIGACGFTLRPRLGIDTITADDFFKSRNWWKIITTR
jgi:uncharacterized protein YycO